jgi:hypothetical protein
MAAAVMIVAANTVRNIHPPKAAHDEIIDPVKNLPEID